MSGIETMDLIQIILIAFLFLTQYYYSRALRDLVEVVADIKCRLNDLRFAYRNLKKQIRKNKNE